MTVVIVAGAFASLAAMSGRFSNMLRSANDSTMIAQTLQERLEMIRSASWSTITSEEIPPNDEDVGGDDPTDESTDPTNEVLTDPTVFPDDLSDATDSQPGLLDLLDTATASGTNLGGLTETVTVSKYPEGSTPIRVQRSSNGTLTVLSHNKDLVNENMLRVVVELSWIGANNAQVRKQSGQIILTKSSQ